MSIDKKRAHLIVGGFPVGSMAGHDMDYARLQLLQQLYDIDNVHCTVASDYADLDKWLDGTHFLLTYVAGPFPHGEQVDRLNQWLADGGRWFALHGTNGGKAVRVTENPRPKRMVKMAHHESLGSFFLNHPPIRKFEVNVTNASHPLTQALPTSFNVVDELYLIEMLDDDAQVLMTTDLATDPSPSGFGFVYDDDTSLQADGKTRVLGYSRRVGNGEVVYLALGHCHCPMSNSQPFVDESAYEGGITPPVHRDAWENPAFQRALKNACAWGLHR
ncbi:MAG: ThuA domain-containing protein [Pseudomonadota bacterium]